ncbi:M24 family metallopeptidase [Streptococcus oricebi]|uniref:Aminopeptidase P family protein n=1 Tax=Streptococcus oricebi TaxID=1547447 RepID=A0ABS5B5L2_9STRE|nr:Xaa-Pro peptidase family protein [Streptococcus oricebi]MBP2623991.1 aminopeptidase P family protein [Streptococcus oricebi]
MNKRLEKFLSKLTAAQLDGVLINNLKNVYYLTGFWGSNATVFISHKRLILFTDARYQVHAHETVKDFEIIITRDELGEAAKIIKEEQLQKIGFESEISFAYYKRLSQAFAGAELTPLTNFVEELRWIKDEEEVATIKQACQISDQAFLDVLDFIKPGKTELEIATFLDFRMRELGASGVSFDIIAASGDRTSMPHAVPSQKQLELGDTLTLDFGCLYQHYVSDMTRTVYIGSVNDQQEEIYQTVLKANQALIEAARAGLSFRDFDKIPRDIIEAAGYGPYFSHGIGHGIGLDIHEEPYFSQTSKEVIQAGMVLTDEPGIYIEGQNSGVRIEDDLLITETGCQVLTLAPKELIVVK